MSWYRRCARCPVLHPEPQYLFTLCPPPPLEGSPVSLPCSPLAVPSPRVPSSRPRSHQASGCSVWGADPWDGIWGVLVSPVLAGNSQKLVYPLGGFSSSRRPRVLGMLQWCRSRSSNAGMWILEGDTGASPQRWQGDVTAGAASPGVLPSPHRKHRWHWGCLVLPFNSGVFGKWVSLCGDPVTVSAMRMGLGSSQSS